MPLHDRWRVEETVGRELPLDTRARRTHPRAVAGSGKGIGAWLRANWFVVALAGAVALAWLLPAPGAKGGFLHGEITSKAAVAGIFFTQGLVLALEALKQGALQWRLHAYVQAFTFLVFPAAGFALDALLGGSLPDGLRTGLLFLCVLPTTVSTAAVLTGLAGGNLAGALFNVTLSNVLGVFLTPLWVGVLLSRHGGSRPLGAVIGEVCLLLLVPLALGQVTRSWLGATGWTGLRCWSSSAVTPTPSPTSGPTWTMCSPASSSPTRAHAWLS